MYGPDVAILLMYESHDMRHTGFRKLTVVNRTPRNWGVTFNLRSITHRFQIKLINVIDNINSNVIVEITK